jgi:hypothetical protein
MWVRSRSGADEGRERDSRACFANAAVTMSEEDWSGWLDRAVLEIKL